MTRGRARVTKPIDPQAPARALRCPSCGAEVESDPGARGPSFPFCRVRCRMADLGRWFNEDYRIAGRRSPEAGAAEPADGEGA